MDREEDVHRFEISGEMDRATAEALQLEIRRLAKGYGFDIVELRIEEVENEPD